MYHFNIDLYIEARSICHKYTSFLQDVPMKAPWSHGVNFTRCAWHSLYSLTGKKNIFTQAKKKLA